MKYPRLKEIQTARDTNDIFYGYNHQLKIGDGEFYDMENLTSQYFPIMAPRPRRGVYADGIRPRGMIAKDTLCYVDGTDFVMDQYRIDMGLNDEEKQLISMGAYVIIMPDKKYINTVNIDDRGDIEARARAEGNVEFLLSTEEGTEMEVTYVQSDEPSGAQNMERWIDTSSTPHTLKQYSAASDTWAAIPTTYIRIGFTGLGHNFSAYDGVNLKGLAGNEDAQIAALDGSFTVWSAGDDWIVVTGIIDEAKTIPVELEVSRTMPIMDFVIESHNRLWGCHYGLTADGTVVNEIYASKLGDFKNWSTYMGISTDSYTASCGTDGPFTGAITHLGYPVFFKENHLHKVYGNYPSNFQIQDTACRGVQKGSAKSMAIVNEVLYYKSRNGICSYDGSLPNEISAAFGEEQYSNAVGGSHGNKYYISMDDSNGNAHLFIYDARNGVWHKEDGTRATGFCSCRNEMYIMDNSSIRTVFGTGVKENTPVKWMAETGILGAERQNRYATQIPGKKYISQMQIRMSMEIGATVGFDIMYDSSGIWEHVTSMKGTHLRSFCVPIRPRRCDHFRLRFQGEGDVRIYSMTKTIERGSDL